MTAHGKNGQILVAGSLAFDHIMSFPGYFKDHILPEKVHMINISFLVDKVEKQRGGCAANIAYTMALLGARPRIVAAAGHDFSEYSAWLAEQGVDVNAIHIVPDEITATCFVTTDRADNQITGFYVGAMARAREISVREVAGPHPAVLVVAPDDPDAMLRHCREAREMGLPVVYDPSFQVTALSGDKLMEGAAGARAMVLNDYEFAVFQEKTGKSRAELLETIELLVVTVGDQGSRIYTRQGAVEVPSARPRQVVDPTGAGDAYRGGFVTGLVWGADLGECGRMGSVAAAYAIENYGTQNHHYGTEQFAARYQENFGARPACLGCVLQG
ncbi:MAG: carbohydrate kinase family protein [Armatimonadetes bacterium]|nr:carbohydrate kinase family protein [Armatimonadota bacterium]